VSILGWFSFAACLGASVVAGARWLRVLQREHYLAGSTTTFALRWWRVSPLHVTRGVVGLLTAFGALAAPVLALPAALVAATDPRGLSVRGRTSKLAWTRRLRTVALLTALLEAAIVALGILAGRAAAAAALCAMALPLLVDAAAWLLMPLERRLGERYVVEAAARLSSVAPRVVGITGSYGKTSTKNHLTALIGTDRAVVPSPRSFNNRAGLARAINEHLAPGTDVFIAEMGTYGPGEIADLVAWCPPEIAVMTAIGPVHLERFGSLEVTVAAKAEIVLPATTVVINIDDPLLRGLAGSLTAVTVVRASAEDATADVAVVATKGRWSIWVAGAELANLEAPRGVQPTNVACALGAALALGIDAPTAARRIGALIAVENRQSVIQAPSGLSVIDDTFNANPAGAAAALDLLASLAPDGARAVVTPGMIELGDEQAPANRAFAERAAAVADHLVIVGRTNAPALLDGAAAASSSVEILEVPDRAAAVDWVRAHLGGRDAVLYENDLPDHYP